MCLVIADMLFTLHDLGLDSKQIVITDALRTALSHKTTMQVKAIEAAAKGWIDRHKKARTERAKIAV